MAPTASEKPSSQTDPAGSPADEALGQANTLSAQTDPQPSASTDPQAEAIAKIGDTSYPTFQAALDAASDGQTIVLVDNVALSESLTIDKAVTLDLGQKTIATSAADWALVFTKDATVRGGTIAAETGSGILAKGCTVTIDDAVVNANGKALQAGVFDAGNSSEQMVGHLVIDGESTSITSQVAGVLVVGINAADDAEKSSLVVNGGTIEGLWYGVLGNGSYDNTSITLNGGTVRGTDPDDNAGIYHPQQGDLTINEGATVEGKVGVQMGGGTLVVNGGTIKSNDSEARTAPYKTPSESDGNVLDGSALSVVSRAGGYGDIGVEVKGGTFETANANNDAVKMYGFQKGATAWEIIEPPTSVAMSITGGTFASNPSAFVTDGYKAAPQENGTYSVVDARVVELTAPDGTVDKFTTLKEAVAAAETTDFSTKAAPEQPTAIKLLADTNDGIDIGTSGKLLQNIVLDLNGHTLTLGPTVGSANTETNGVRVLSYSKLQVMNGKVVCSSLPQQLPDGKETYIKVGFANYGTLSLDNVDVLAGDYTQLTVNNRGALTLSGATSIESGKAVDMVAVTNDVYDAHYTDFDASLNVADDTVMVGKVLVERYEYDRKGNAGHVALNISAGTYGEIVDDGETSVPVDCNITGGTFASDSSAFVADGYEVVQNDDGTYTVGAVKAVSVTVGDEELFFASLADGLAAAQGAPVKMLRDLSEDVVIDETSEASIDLNGFTLTNVSGNTISNQGGVLTISDSSEGQTGVVDCITHGKAALYNVALGAVTITGGTFTRSAEAGTKDGANGNSYYTVHNQFGTLNVEGGVIRNTSSFSSLVRNDATMLVSGGTLQQDGIIAVNNYSNGTFTMTGGEIVSKDDQGIINWNEATITGGTINAKHAVASYADATDTGATTIADGAVINGTVRSVAYTNAVGVPSMQITGGEVNGSLQKQTYNKADKSFVDVDADSPTSDLVVTGGTFDNDPSAFVAEGYEAAKNAEGKYLVQKQGNEVRIGETEYATLADAVAAVQADGSNPVITVLKNLTIKDNIDIGSPDGAPARSVVIDLDGHTVTKDSSTGDSTWGIWVYANQHVAFKNGTFTSDANSNGLFRVRSGGELKLDFVTLSNSKNGYGAVMVDEGGKASLVTVTINSENAYCILSNGGIVDTYESCVFKQTGFEDGLFAHTYAAIVAQNGGTVNMNRGQVVSDGYGAYVLGSGGTINIGHLASGTWIDAKKAALKADHDGKDQTKSVIDVAGGWFKGAVEQASGAVVALSGGVYDVDVSNFVAEDYECVENGQAERPDEYPYIVQMKQVAQVIGADGVEGEVYPNLQAAIDAAQAGETVKLVKDIDLGDSVSVSADKDMTLDLNGHTITASDTAYPFNNAGVLRLCDKSGAEKLGEIVGSGGETYAVVRTAGENASLRIEGITITTQARAVFATDGATVEMLSGKLQGKYALRAANTVSDLTTKVSISGGELVGSTQAVYLNANIKAIEGGSIPYPVEVTVSGSANIKATGESAITVRGNGAKLNVEGGTIEGASGFGAIDGNGTMGAGGTEINVSGGVVKGGAEDSVGIYHPQAGTLNVTGGTISGTTGIEMRAGTLNVSGDTTAIKGGTDEVTVTPNGNGGTTANAAVAVAQHTTKLPVEVNISGGTLTGGAALYESNPQNNGADDIAKVGMSVTGGKFAGTVFSHDVEKFVSGGLFGAVVDEAYIVESFECSASGDESYPYEVVAMEHARIGDVVYPTLEAAFAAVQAGDTITVLKDTQLTDSVALAVEGAVTLDLAGHTVLGPVSEVSAAIVSKNDAYTTDLAIMSSEPEGTIDCSAGTCEVVKSYGALTLGENVKLIGNARANSVTSLGGTVEVNGADISGGNCAVGLFNRNYDNEGTQEENPSAHLTVNSGTLGGVSFAVSTNNLKSAGCTVVVNGGTLATDYTAIYWAAEGSVEVNDGAISGQTGIEMKMGDLVVNGGTIAAVTTSDGKPDGSPDKPNNGGSTEDGSGIYLVGKFYGASGKQFRESPDLSATINGGAITSACGNSVSVYEGAAAVSNAAKLVVPEGKNAALTAASGKQQVAYYSASGVEVPATRISVLGIEGVEKHALTYAGVDDMALENPTQITKYDIVDIANPSKLDNAFKGWTVDPDANKGDAFNVVLQGVMQDTTLSAGWQTVEGKADIPPAVSDEPLADDAPTEIGTPAEHQQAVEEQAKEAAESIVKNVVENSEAAGVSAEDAKKIQQVVETAAPENKVTSTIAVTAETKDEAAVQEDADKIKSLVGSAAVEQYLDLKVTMVVEETGALQANKAEVPLTTVEKPIPFSVKVAPSKLKNTDDNKLKGVLIAVVHDGTASTIVPESIDYEKGIITFFADKFSTYGVVLSESTASEPTYLESINAFFANGTLVVISENTGADAAEKPVLVTWVGANGSGTMALDSNVSIFGGGHNDGRTFETTNVSMNGGTVRNIFGGGLHKSNVVTANVVVNGGTVASVSGGGAALLKDDGCGSAVAGSYPADKAKINNFVNVANVTVNGDAVITSTVFGGGESISSVETANVTISGGDLSGAWVTAGGANGYTGNAKLNITGGTIKVVQGANRGGIDSVNMDITGGEIANLYLGGEAGDSSVTGTIGAIDAVIGGQAKVDKLATGTSGGADLAGQAGVGTSLKVEDTSKVGNFAEFAKTSGDNLAVDATLDLSASTNVVTFDPAAITAPYAAQSIKPEPKVLVNGVELDKGLYFFTYDKNVLPGTGTITVHGNDYVAGKTQIKGTASMNFTITAASKSNLQTALANAKALRDATAASTNGYDVVVGSWWASANAINAYGQAVMQADYANVQSFITQADVDAAVSNLAKATSAFNSARHQVKSLNKSVLAANISAAKALRNATTKSANGSDVAPGTWWATPLAMGAYNQAIAKAEGVNGQAKTTQAAVNAAAADMASATGTFQAARKQGTKQETVAGSVKRLAGNVATGTSQAISKEGFTKSDYAVVVRNDGFHDAMSATGLAGAYDCPILLTETGTLSSETKSEIQRLGAKTVFVIGGTAAVSANVENQIKGLGAKVQRLAGSDAPDTSIQCAKAIQQKTGTSANAIMATSSTFQDALSMASFAYAHKVPILLLSASGQVVDGAKPYLAAASRVFVPGGTAAVSDAAVAPYKAKATRFAGSDAFDTSNKIAEYMVKSGLLGDANVGVANGLLYNGVDALSGSALMGKRSGVILLTSGDGGGATIDGFMKSHGSKVARAYVFGGTAVVTPTLYSKIESLVK